MIYDSENATAFVILTGTVVFYGLVYCLIRRIGREQQKKKGQSAMQKITVWCCETCAEVYHIEAQLCPTCAGYLQHKTFDTMCQLTAYIGRIEMEQYRHALERRMPGMTITQEDAFLFHSFEHRNECVLFARCCEADPTASMRPSPVNTLPVSEENILLREQREFWRGKADR
jgi:hypothetical protein